MFDLVKYQKIGDHKSETGVNSIKFWDLQKSFVSSTVTGDLIVNGFGSKSGYLTLPVMFGDAINDFRLKGEFGVLVCGNESQVFEVDIRKGVINPN